MSWQDDAHEVFLLHLEAFGDDATLAGQPARVLFDQTEPVSLSDITTEGVDTVEYDPAAHPAIGFGSAVAVRGKTYTVSRTIPARDGVSQMAFLEVQ